MARSASAATSMPQHVQRDAQAAVGDRTFTRCAEEAAHQHELHRQQRAHPGGVQGLLPVQQQGDHGQLRQRHDPAGHLSRALRPQANRQRADAHARVAVDRLEVVERHDAVRAERCRARPAPASARLGAPPDITRGAGDPGQALVAQPAGCIAPPAVALQAQRRRAVGPGQRQAEDRRRQRPRARGAGRHASESSVQTMATYESPAARACDPRGSGGCGSLIASTSRSNQSFTAWLVAQTRGPASTTPAASRPSRPSVEAPEATTPQAKAHIGGNQVIGLRSSATAEGAGRRMAASCA